MSVWTEDGLPGIAVRRSSRRLSVTPSDVASIATTTTSTASSTPDTATPRKLMHPKSSMIPRLHQIEETMASSDEDVAFLPATEPKKGRGRLRKSPARTKMTATTTPASTVPASAFNADAAITPSARVAAAKRDRTPPRSRSSSRTRKSPAAAAAATPTKSPAATPRKMAPPVLNLDDESPVVTRRSTRLAAKTPSANGHANGFAKATPAPSRETTEQWRDEFTEKHPVFTKMVIPALICLVYAALILAACWYFDLQKQAPKWFDLAAQSVNDMYDDFMARRAAGAPAAGH